MRRTIDEEGKEGSDLSDMMQSRLDEIQFIPFSEEAHPHTPPPVSPLPCLAGWWRGSHRLKPRGSSQWHSLREASFNNANRKPSAPSV